MREIADDGRGDHDWCTQTTRTTAWAPTRERTENENSGRSKQSRTVGGDRQLLPRAGMEWMEHRASGTTSVCECERTVVDGASRGLMRVSIHTHQISPTRTRHVFVYRPRGMGMQRRMDACWEHHGHGSRVTALLLKPSSEDSRVIVIVSSVSVPDHIHTKGRRGSIFTHCFHQQDRGHCRANVRYDHRDVNFLSRSCLFFFGCTVRGCPKAFNLRGSKREHGIAQRGLTLSIVERGKWLH
jgi:hypothetical protein